MNRAQRYITVCRQSGAALVVGLILMLVLTILGVSGMTVTVFGLTMASNAQFHENAFQAAESGIDVMIERRNFSTAGPTVLPSTSIGDGNYEMAGTMNFAEATPVPDRAFSIGVTNGGVQAYHFNIVATGTGPDSASSTQNQSFYVVGPGN